MPMTCNNCGAGFEGEWELEEIVDPSGHAKKVCPACDNPQSTFAER